MGITEGNAQGESRTPTSLRTTDFKYKVLVILSNHIVSFPTISQAKQHISNHIEST